jgi:hypothetical protein
MPFDLQHTLHADLITLVLFKAIDCQRHGIFDGNR